LVARRDGRDIGANLLTFLPASGQRLELLDPLSFGTLPISEFQTQSLTSCFALLL
jgi:hypothetical protein